MSKQYGLILPKSKAKAGPSALSRPKVASVFNDDSSDDEDTKAVVSGGTDWMKRKLASANSKSGATGIGTKIKSQTKMEMKKALEHDPTVFQYDEVYDQMEATKEEKVSEKKAVDRKPRYITNLLKQAEIREKENERRIERKVQKEREAEGDEFADKEKFVTSAYRKKMEEMQKLEEEEKRKEAIEEILDVRKQKDMSGFYRHLYRQTMGEEKGQSEEEKPKVKTELLSDEENEKKDIEENDVHLSKKTKPSQRSYRRRDTEPLEADDNDSQDQSSSSDESGDDEEDEAKLTAVHQGAYLKSDANDNKENDVEEATQQLPKKPKIDIWKKVTVGMLFDDALQRYLQRKAERGNNFPW